MILIWQQENIFRNKTIVKPSKKGQKENRIEFS